MWLVVVGFLSEIKTQRTHYLETKNATIYARICYITHFATVLENVISLEGYKIMFVILILL